MLIELEKLKEIKPVDPTVVYAENRLKDRLSDKTTNYRENHITQSTFPISATYERQSTYFHMNYLKYLDIAYYSHLGVVFSPDILWFTLLNELASIIKKDPKEYKRLFSETEEKQTIIMVTTNPSVIPLPDLIDSLKTLVPTDVSLFLPEFSTTNQMAQIAQYSAFADAVSPYYDYCCLSCGIPSVKIMGTSMDYATICGNWIKIGKLFNTHADYFERVEKILNKILVDTSPEFWKKMFYMERCGSGGQQDIYGWFSELFFEQPKNFRFTDNFPSSISKVEYTGDGRNYQMFNGIFSSLIEDKMLIPCFGNIIYEKQDKPTITKQTNVITGIVKERTVKEMVDKFKETPSNKEPVLDS